jgi:hypothetical protein
METEYDFSDLKEERPEEKVAPEVAKKDFYRMLKKWNIVTKMFQGSELDKKDRMNQAEEICDAIRYGQLSITEDTSLPVLHTQDHGDIKFGIPKQSAKLAMDKRSRDEFEGKMTVALNKWCNVNCMSDLLSSEIKISQSIYMLFFT